MQCDSFWSVQSRPAREVQTGTCCLPGLDTHAAQVVLAPVVAGALLNRTFPRQVARAAAFTPLLAVAMTVAVCASIIAASAGSLQSVGLPLLLAVTALHTGEVLWGLLWGVTALHLGRVLRGLLQGGRGVGAAARLHACTCGGVRQLQPEPREVGVVPPGVWGWGP